ncbi:hypothetical protein EIMP300_74030 [Escherichia coli]|uniref:Acriflavin resistance protein B n=1 Tax=Escherichia coli TaxID=562 RepID=A0A8S0G241_ECOLX|nr:hypothetical protein EIMP300_74030 [Escherichia coli]
MRATRAFSQIKDAMVFAFNLPAIVELGTATGFDFELIDQAGLGHEKLTQARNQLLAEAAKHPDMLTSVRPNGLEDTPQFKIDIDQEKAQALGVSINDINTTLGAAWGGSYVNDFIDRGRVKKVYVMSEAKYRMLPDDIGDWYVRAADGQIPTRRGERAVLGVLLFSLGVRFAASGTLQRPAIYGNLRPGGTG